MSQGHPRFPRPRPQRSGVCDGRNFTAVPLVTVSDKYRGLWSSPLQLCLCLLVLGARERPHHLGAATVLIHPHPIGITLAGQWRLLPFCGGIQGRGTMLLLFLWIPTGQCMTTLRLTHNEISREIPGLVGASWMCVYYTAANVWHIK